MSTAVRPRDNPIAYRSLIWNLARRDLKNRYRGTALGWLWSLMLPLATLLTFALVFSVVFRFEAPPMGGGRPGNVTVWLLAGLVVWNLFLATVSAAIPNLLATGPLFQKVYVPAYAPIIGTTIAVLVQSLVEIAVLLVALLILGNASVTWLLVPAWLVLVVPFVAAIASAAAILNVYYRDVAHLVAVALQLMFYLTPIIYSLSLVPEAWHGLPLQAILGHLPLAEFVGSFRALLYELTVPDVGTWLAMLLWSAGASAVSYSLYRVRGRDLGEFT